MHSFCLALLTPFPRVGPFVSPPQRKLHALPARFVNHPCAVEGYVLMCANVGVESSSESEEREGERGEGEGGRSRHWGRGGRGVRAKESSFILVPLQQVGCVAVNSTCSSSSKCDFPSGCDAATGLCTLASLPAATTCSDGNACTADSCNPLTGCVWSPIVCNDNNTCTDDFCNGSTGCVFLPSPCTVQPAARPTQCFTLDPSEAAPAASANLSCSSDFVGSSGAICEVQEDGLCHMTEWTKPVQFNSYQGTNITFPYLRRTSTVAIRNCPFLQSVSFPRLELISQNLLYCIGSPTLQLRNLTMLTSMDFSSLERVASAPVCDGGIGEISLDQLPLLTSVEFDSLWSVGTISIATCGNGCGVDLLSSVSFAALEEISGNGPPCCCSVVLTEFRNRKRHVFEQYQLACSV